MLRNCSKKGIFIGTIILVANLFFIPVFTASTSSINIQKYPVELSVEKPDLIINEIGFAPTGDAQLEDVACASIQNIGSAKAEGNIYVKYTFIRLLFGVIPIKIAQTGTRFVYRDGGLQPQQFTYVEFIYENELPKFGIFELKCTVNPGRTIEESNYDNNDLSQKFIAFFGQWS